MSPKGACGDVVRNVTGCPLAGLDHEELLDASPLAVEITHALTANPDFVNLPRKFKISVTGCPLWCSYPEINDVGLTALKRVKDGVGGGWIRPARRRRSLHGAAYGGPAECLCAAREGVGDDHGGMRDLPPAAGAAGRIGRAARLKYLFLRYGWTAESMLAAVEEKMGFKFDPCEEGPIADDLYRDHVGVRRQKQEGLSSVGATVLRGAAGCRKA